MAQPRTAWRQAMYARPHHKAWQGRAGRMWCRSSWKKPVELRHRRVKLSGILPPDDDLRTKGAIALKRVGAEGQTGMFLGQFTQRARHVPLTAKHLKRLRKHGRAAGQRGQD